MAKASIEVIEALDRTMAKLATSNHYQWGHMGSCNCGFLAQEVLKVDRQTIHRRAMERYGDWSEQLNDYCPTSGYSMDDLISGLIDFGFDTTDLKNLERLSDPRILHQLPLEKRNLRHNVKADVLIYLKTWKELLEEKLTERIVIPDIELSNAVLTER